jgi:Tfp pilus assembly protein PilX
VSSSTIFLLVVLVLTIIALVVVSVAVAVERIHGDPDARNGEDDGSSD